MTRSPLSTLGGCHVCPIRAEGVCGGLSGPEVSQIETVREARRLLPSGHDLFRQGEPCELVFNLIRGWVFLYELLEDGRRQIVDFALPGDLIGFGAEGRASAFGAQALVDTEICVISRRRLMAFTGRHPRFALRLLSILAADEQRAYERLTSLGRKSALERMAALILELFFRCHHRPPRLAGDVLAAPLTQTLIADATGLTPVHTNRTLQELRQRRVIDYGNGLFHILDPTRLFEIARIDPDLCAWGASPEMEARAPLAPSSFPP